MDDCNEHEVKSAAPSGDAALLPMSSVAKASEPSIGAPESNLVEVPAPAIASVDTDTPKSGGSTAQATAEALQPAVPNIKDSRSEGIEAAAPGAQPAKPSASVAQPKLDWIKSLMMKETSAPREPLAVAVADSLERDPRRSRRFVVFAASLTAAVALGALGGALAVSAVATPAAAPAPTPTPTVSPVATEDTQALKALVSQLRADISALKVSIETSNKAANGQFAKMTERFDRIERVQAEPAARIGKAVEAIERMERRADTGAAKEATGSVSIAPAAPGTPLPPASATAVQPVPGWSVREVYRGVALIQSPRFGLIEVEAGDVIPGIGRVESIRKQDGHWVVTTSRGVIASR